MITASEHDYLFKLLLLGDSGVGCNIFMLFLLEQPATFPDIIFIIFYNVCYYIYIREVLPLD